MPKLPSLAELSTNVNIANYLNETTLATIGDRVVTEYESDCRSRVEWEETYHEALKIAKQIKETKTFPFDKAANIKYPLITMAAIQFAARAYPEIIQDGRVAGCKVVGKDPDGSKQDRADRVSTHMSYQLTDQMETWDEDTDRMLHVLPISGLCWKKTYHTTNKGNQSDFVLPLDFVVHYHTKSMDTCPRGTHVFPKYPNEIEERKRSGEWMNVELGAAVQVDGYDQTDTNTPHIFLEQHRWWDLDNDGYQEPYIITVHKDTKQVVRIVARFDEDDIKMLGDQVLKINAKQYWTKYGFIPAPDGSFYDIGFGALLNPLNEAINTMFNQLTDAGTLNNAGGGFIGKNVKMQGGNTKFRLGEWKVVDVAGGTLKDNIVPKPASEPSAVLFQLLGLLIEVTKELSTVSDEMSGQPASPNETATSTLTRIEQGMKVFSAIHKRVYRSLTKELKKIYDLNRVYTTQAEYSNIVDDPQANVKEDYEDKSINVRPVADPNMTTDIQRILRAQAAAQIVASTPGGNLVEMGRRSLKAIHIEDIDKLIPEEAPKAPTDPKVELERAKMEVQLKKDQAQMTSDQQKADADLKKAQAEMQLRTDENKAKAIIDFQKLELDREKFELDKARFKFEAETKVAELQMALQELRDKVELESTKFDNALKLKEQQFRMDLKSKMKMKKMDLGLPSDKDDDGDEDTNSNIMDQIEMAQQDMLESLQPTQQAISAMQNVLEQTIAAVQETMNKVSAPKQLIRDAVGQITHVMHGDEIKPVQRDENGQIIGV